MDVARLIEIAEKVAKQVTGVYHGRNQAHPYDWEDVRQHLLTYAYDPEAQSKRGIKILAANDDRKNMANLRTIAYEFLQESVYRANEAGKVWAVDGLKSSTAADELEREAIDKRDRRVSTLFWDDDDSTTRAAEIELERALAAIAGHKYPSEGHRFVADVLASEPGESPWMDDRRRLLAAALWRYWRAGHGRGVLLACRKYRQKARLTRTDNRHLNRAVVDIVNEVNRVLVGLDPRFGDDRLREHEGPQLRPVGFKVTRYDG